MSDGCTPRMVLYVKKAFSSELVYLRGPGRLAVLPVLQLLDVVEQLRPEAHVEILADTADHLKIHTRHGTDCQTDLLGDRAAAGAETLLTGEM